MQVTFLHAPTVFLMTLLVSSIMATVVLVFWHFNRDQPGLNDWGLTAIIGLVTLVSIGLRDRLPELVAVWLTNVCLLLMPYLAWSGSRVYLGLTRPNLRRATLFSIAVLALITYFTVTQPSLNARVALQSLFAGCLYGITARTIAVGGWRRYPARYTFALALALHAMFMLSFRPWLLITGNADVTDNRLVLTSWLLMESMVSYLLMSMGIIILVYEHSSAKLTTLAQIDPLTKVFNRNTFMTLLNKARSRCERQGMPLSLMMIDLDQFKRINDSWGHQAGDQVLRQFAVLASMTLRKEDVIGRFGGEEFCILLPGVHLDEAQEIGERLRQACEIVTVVFENMHISYTISIGIAQVKENESWEAVIQMADRAMYRAKNVGRNRIEVTL